MLKDLITSTAAEPMSPQNCGACGSQIHDRFYLLTGDTAWHIQCLKCYSCSQHLDTELSCFSRDGNIYCKEDYYRIFSLRRCARCGSGISSTELIMRAKDLVFHLGCFSCVLCSKNLSTGDMASVRENLLICGDHFEADLLNLSFNGECNSISSEYFPTNSQKGRPRKRKPQSLTQNMVESDNCERNTPLRLDILRSDITNTNLELSSYDGSQSPVSSGALTPTSRNKRMRTSFKHHQLRTMKSYFAINQNPDAKDLKQLAQKTGLSKRVLQVWFQNARAKWRRNVMRHQDGTGGDLVAGNISNGLNGPGSMGGVGGSNGVILSHNALNISSIASNSIKSDSSSHGGMDEVHHNMNFAELY